MNDRKVVTAVHEGRLAEADVDALVGRILDLVYTKLDTLKNAATFDVADHDARARAVAGQCAVLLKTNQQSCPAKRPTNRHHWPFC